MYDYDEKQKCGASRIYLNDDKSKDNSTKYHLTSTTSLLNLSIPVKSGLKTHSTSIAVISPEPTNAVNGDYDNKYA